MSVILPTATATDLGAQRKARVAWWDIWVHQEAKINPRSASEALQTLHILIQGVPQTPFLSLTTALWSTCEAAPGAAWLPGTVDPTDLSVPAADLKLKDRNNPVPTASQPAHNWVLFRPPWSLVLPFPRTLAQSQPTFREGLDQPFSWTVFFHMPYVWQL